MARRPPIPGVESFRHRRNQRSERSLGLITPVVLSFILILANRRSVLGSAANGPVFRKVSLAAVAAVATLSMVLLLQTVTGWVGLA